MRKLLLPLLVVVSLAAVGAAAGSTSKTVTISKTGYTPTAVTITTGDAVIFKNTDTVAHTLVLSPTTGVNCGGAVPLAIPAGQSATCTFSSAGKFKFSDPASKKKAFRGTITVTPPLVSSVTATPKNVLYGHTSTIAGKVASGQSGQSVQISEQGCRGTSTVAATVTTTAGGAFSYQAQPVDNTSYTLSSQGLTSSISIGVKPRLHLAKIGAHRYKLQVFAAQNFLGTRATFQRYRASVKRWVAVKRVKFQTAVNKKSPTVITSVKFRSGIRAHLRVRASLGPKQARPCYLAGRSNTIRS
jgi:plastocyanin